MNAFIAGIGKIMILEALAALLLASWFFERSARQGRWFDRCLAAVALLAALSYFNFGHFRGQGYLVHAHEQYHFYLGSKYLQEIRYDGIYRASALAAHESGESLERWKVRDP